MPITNEIEAEIEEVIDSKEDTQTILIVAEVEPRIKVVLFSSEAHSYSF
jgi:prephenate dehydratase